MDILHGNLKAIESTSFRNLHLGGNLPTAPHYFKSTDSIRHKLASGAEKKKVDASINFTYSTFMMFHIISLLTQLAGAILRNYMKTTWIADYLRYDLRWLHRQWDFRLSKATSHPKGRIRQHQWPIIPGVTKWEQQLSIISNINREVSTTYQFAVLSTFSIFQYLISTSQWYNLCDSWVGLRLCTELGSQVLQHNAIGGRKEGQDMSGTTARMWERNHIWKGVLPCFFGWRSLMSMKSSNVQVCSFYVCVYIYIYIDIDTNHIYIVAPKCPGQGKRKVKCACKHLGHESKIVHIFHTCNNRVLQLSEQESKESWWSCINLDTKSTHCWHV